MHTVGRSELFNGFMYVRRRSKQREVIIRLMHENLRVWRRRKNLKFAQLWCISDLSDYSHSRRDVERQMKINLNVD